MDILDWIRNERPPMDFVLPGLLAGTVGAIISPGGTGKSMLALELALLTSTGFDLPGFGSRGGGRQHTHTGKVAFLSAEDPAEAIGLRLFSLGRYMDEGLRELFAESTEIANLDGIEIDIDRKEWLNFVESMANGKRLMILDTLRRFHQLDENDGSEMSHLIVLLQGIAKRTRCTIIFLHHTNKAAALNGQGDLQQASRGSSVLVDNIRWQMYLTGCTKDEAKTLGIDEERRGQFVRVGISKQNFGAPLAEFWLQRGDGGVLVPATLSTRTRTNKKSVEEKW
jgi:RecA-family ATPase